MEQKEKQLLQELARKQLEYSQSEQNKELIRLWREHNTLRGRRPMIHIEVDSFEQEVIAPLMRCESSAARKIEYRLYHSFLNQQVFGDDTPIRDYFPIAYDTYFHLFGQQIGTTTAANLEGNTLGHRFHHVIGDLEQDFHKLGATQYGVDYDTTRRYREEVEDAIGAILPVRMEGSCLYAVPTQKVVHRMGMENMLFAMVDYPELFKQMMDRIAEDYRSYFEFLEQEGLILPTTDFAHLGQGSFSFTDELPDGEDLHTDQVWGFLDSQETVSISPEMFAEFIAPCYEKIADLFGLLSYGCCEPVHPFWTAIKKLKNLRKVSISPWCNEEYMAEELRGSGIIFHRKPSPNFLGVEKSFDEEAWRRNIEQTLQTARGCKVEITQRDVYTIHHDLGKVKRYIEIIRESIENCWQ